MRKFIMLFCCLAAFAILPEGALAQDCGECAEDSVLCVVGCELEDIEAGTCTICWSGDPCME